MVGDEGQVALVEHGVVDLVLRGEVRVDRLRLHPDPVTQVAHGQPRQALLAHELPRRGDDLVLGLLAAGSASVDADRAGAGGSGAHQPVA